MSPHLRRWVLGWATLLVCFAGTTQARTVLNYEALMHGGYAEPVSLDAFLPDAGALPPAASFEGVLRITGHPQTRTIKVDTDFVDPPGLAAARTLPADFDYEFVQDGAAIVPVRRGPLASSHPWWEFILEPGRVWSEPGDHGYSRAAIPFALQEKNANCTHNGVLMFLFRADGSVSRAALQVSTETCRYLQLDIWGFMAATYVARPVAERAATLLAYRAEVGSRLPTRSLAQLGHDYPQVNVQALAIGAARARTVYGLVVNGVNYVSACATRYGDYPYCEVMDLPSYSTAKSAFAAIALMRLQALTHQAASQPVSAWVGAAACQQSSWSDVSFQDVLDMATGHYDSKLYEADEDAAKTQGLFLPLDHASKIAYACGAYPRSADPGSVWVYHTSDTYLLGSAMNGYLRSLPDHASQDLFTDVLVADVFRPLGLSPVTHNTRRTYDRTRQPFTGWGLTYHYDDIARLAGFLNNSGGRIGDTQVLDAGMLATALQRNPQDRGLQTAGLAHFRYKSGFWARDVQGLLGCAQPTWIPFMSGFGGISVVLFPNGIIYYNFADDGQLASFDWGSAARQVRAIADYCQ